MVLRVVLGDDCRRVMPIVFRHLSGEIKPVAIKLTIFFFEENWGRFVALNGFVSMS